VEFEQCEKGGWPNSALSVWFFTRLVQPGEYLDEGSGECKRCEAGKYSPGGVTTCELCSRYGDKYAALVCCHGIFMKTHIAQRSFSCWSVSHFVFCAKDEDGDVVCNDCPASGGAECVAGQLTAKAGFWVSKDENGVVYFEYFLTGFFLYRITAIAASACTVFEPAGMRLGCLPRPLRGRWDGNVRRRPKT
jgi:hypothetical protein